MAESSSPKKTQYFFDTDTRQTLEAQDSYTFGRSEGNFTFPQDSKISRVHWELKISEDGVYVVDLGSSNGTKINEQELESKDRFKIQRGDIIYFGEQKLIFTGDTRELPEGISAAPVEKSISFSLDIETTEPTIRREDVTPRPDEQVELSMGSRQVKMMRAKAAAAEKEKKEDIRKIVKRDVKRIERGRQIRQEDSPVFAPAASPTRTIDLELGNSLARGDWAVWVLLMGLVIPFLSYLNFSITVLKRSDLLVPLEEVVPKFLGVFFVLPLVILGGHLFAMQKLKPRPAFRILIAAAEIMVFLSLSGSLKNWTGLHEKVTLNQIWYGCMVVGEEEACRAQLRPAYNQIIYKSIPTKQRLAIEDKFPGIQFPTVVE